MSQTNDHQRETARILLETGAVMVNVKKPFTYTSGKRGPVYVDCRRLISFPDARSKLMDMQAAAIRAAGKFDCIAGGETAGIPYAAFLAERLTLPMLYVRKKPKGFGRMAQIEGFMEKTGQHIALVEDVQNYGVSVKVFIDALRAADAVVEHLFVIFSHGHEVTKQAMKELKVETHALADWRAVLSVAKEQGRLDTATTSSVESYLQNPDQWAA